MLSDSQAASEMKLFAFDRGTELLKALNRWPM
jgi:hypothetical protein